MMAILLAVITATAIRSLQSSSEHVNFEQSLAAAESGVDTELSKIQSARNQVPSVAYESSVSCRPATPAASVFATEATEKAWARTALEALPASCTQTNAQGEFVAFKVPGRQAVYSLGWSPSRTAANAEYSPSQSGVHLRAVPSGEGTPHRRHHRLLRKRGDQCPGRASG